MHIFNDRINLAQRFDSAPYAHTHLHCCLVDGSTGFAADVMVDFACGENWLVSLDIRYLDSEFKTTQTIPGEEMGEPDEVYTDPARSIDPMV